MPWVIVTVGLPGSGKTTYLKRKYENVADVVIVSPDDIRKALTGNAIDQTANVKVWEEVYAEIGRHLQNGKNVIVDATMVDSSQRKNLFTFCRKFNPEYIEVLLFKVPFATCMQRNASRQRVVPTYAMERMDILYRKFPPLFEEGFDFIEVLENI